MADTGLVYHRDYLRHEQLYGHPESPARLTAVMDYLKEKGLLDKVDVIEPKPAKVSDILRVHSKQHVDHVGFVCERGGGFLSPDTYTGSESYRIALLACGGLISAADETFRKKKNAFALVRPPGHHATRNFAQGFCIFNNPAVCTRYLQAEHGIRKVLILDWDAHAADGTTKIFYSDPSVLVITLHQDPQTIYPGTGFVEEAGKGEGTGYTLNIPMPPGSGDADYAHIFNEIVLDRVDEFKPGYIIVSAGYDSHKDSVIANLNLTEKGYAWMTEKILEKAEKHCKGRFMVELEGGYNLKALASSVYATLSVMNEPKDVSIRGRVSGGVRELTDRISGEIKSL